MNGCQSLLYVFGPFLLKIYLSSSAIGLLNNILIELINRKINVFKTNLKYFPKNIVNKKAMFENKPKGAIVIRVRHCFIRFFNINWYFDFQRNI